MKNNAVETQNRMIRIDLMKGAKITSLEAIELYNCLRLSARIFDLRKLGMAIKTTSVPTRTGKLIAEYSLAI